STSLPSMACGIVAACTSVGTEKPASSSLFFREGEMGKVEKFCILLSCWQARESPDAHACGITASRPVLIPVLIRVTLKTDGGKLMADILRSGLNRRGRATQPKVISARTL